MVEGARNLADQCLVRDYFLSHENDQNSREAYRSRFRFIQCQQVQTYQLGDYP